MEIPRSITIYALAGVSIDVGRGMLALYYADLKRELLSVRSLITIALMVWVAIGMSKISGALGGGAGLQMSSLLAIYAFFAPFFVGLVFSGIFAYDMETQAIRYVLPFMRRAQIFAAKYLAIITYFLVVVVVSLVVVAVSGHRIEFDGRSLLVLVLSYMYCAALTCLVSIVLGRQRPAMFVSLVLGACLPALGVMAAIWSAKPVWKVVGYLLPFDYFDLPVSHAAILAVIVVVLSATGLVLFDRKDL